MRPRMVRGGVFCLLVDGFAADRDRAAASQVAGFGTSLAVQGNSAGPILKAYLRDKHPSTVAIVREILQSWPHALWTLRRAPRCPCTSILTSSAATW